MINYNTLGNFCMWIVISISVLWAFDIFAYTHIAFILQWILIVLQCIFYKLDFLEMKK